MQAQSTQRPIGGAHTAAEELTLLYDTAPVGLCVLDPTGRFLRINRRLAEINGLPAEAHLGRTMREIVPGLADAGEALQQRLSAELQRRLRALARNPQCRRAGGRPGNHRFEIERFSDIAGGNCNGIGACCFRRGALGIDHRAEDRIGLHFLRNAVHHCHSFNRIFAGRTFG